ncbi:putative ferric-chelate reductase 1 [Bufo gargarizans]|uniref:putative ferric-chelate reductase 1 n=1 Tax=Bufo gargarizans TaxID=30331 RepID=UPI001CF5FE62|nr:putative ferric-chelate reductase 1 [Bufo gargarizans]
MGGLEQWCKELRKEKQMKVFVFRVLIFGFLVSHVSTYSNGLVYKACNTMTPQHGVSAQTTEPPYSVFASSHTYRPAEEITVTLQASPETYFEGFLLQARSIPENEIVGHFIVTDPKSRNLTCAENVVSNPNSNTTSSPIVPSTAASNTTNSPIVPSTAASNTTNSPIVPSTAASNTTNSPIVPSTAASNTTNSPIVLSTAASNTTSSPIVPSTAATNTTSSPIVPSTAASNTTSSPIVPSTAASNTTNGPIVPSTAASNTTNSPIVPSTAASNTSSASSSVPPSSLSSSHPPPPTYISSETCGTQKICLSSPSDCDPSKSSNCFFMSSAMTDDGAYNFEISGLSGGYVSIGFSDDQLMGEDDVYICGINSNGQVEIQHAYTEGRKTPLSLPLGNVNVSMTSFTSGVIQCSFTSRNQISTQLPARQARSSNSSDTYYILFAYGSAENGRIRFHGPGVFSSDTKINLAVASNVTQKEYSTPIMVKTHGALMLIAWMTTGSLGMIIARYFKTAAKKPILGKALWFQAHLVFMVLTVAATIVAFVLSFVQAKGWVYYVSTHAILGCIVMILAFFQPIIAFFRPSPESKQRYIFYWFHVANALVMKVLAVANLFLGFQFIDQRLGWMVKVMGGFVGWGALTVICFEINAYLARKEMNKLADKESKEASVKSEVYLLIIYLCGNLAFLITLLVGIGLS